MTMSTNPIGLPRGWFATAAGGVLGTIAGGFLGMAASSVYADAFQDNDGFEGLLTIIVGTVLFAAIGSVLGAAGALKAFRHNRPAASGLTFIVLGAVLLLFLHSIGQLILPEGLHDGVGVLLLFTTSPVLAGIASRAIFARS
jgi:membrane protease YdiL (CAAX protease family)